MTLQIGAVWKNLDAQGQRKFWPPNRRPKIGSPNLEGQEIPLQLGRPNSMDGHWASKKAIKRCRFWKTSQQVGLKFLFAVCTYYFCTFCDRVFVKIWFMFFNQNTSIFFGQSAQQFCWQILFMTRHCRIHLSAKDYSMATNFRRSVFSVTFIKIDPFSLKKTLRFRTIYATFLNITRQHASHNTPTHGSEQPS